MKVSAFYVLKHERRPGVVLHIARFDIGHRQPGDMPDKEPIHRNLPEHGRFRIVGFLFRRSEGGLFPGAAAGSVNPDIAEPYILDIISRNSADDRGLFRIGIVNDDVADDHASKFPDGGGFLWPPGAIAEPHEDR